MAVTYTALPVVNVFMCVRSSEGIPQGMTQCEELEDFACHLTQEETQYECEAFNPPPPMTTNSEKEALIMVSIEQQCDKPFGMLRNPLAVGGG